MTPNEEIEASNKRIDNIDWNENDVKLEDQRFRNLRGEVLQNIILRQEDHASEAIVQEIKRDNYIYTTRDDIKSEIWFYNDGIYTPHGETYIKEFCRRLLIHAYTPQRANKVIAKIEADTFIDTDKFFNVNYIDEVPIIGGILNIRTREVSEFTPEKVFFNKLPIHYNPQAKCPAVERFFSEILQGRDDVKVAFELFGYSLLKDHRIEKAFMFVGNGRNGKGKFISLLKSFLGSENCCSVPLSQLRSDSSSVCELFGKMANLAGDLNNTALKETGLFKEITGRDMVGAKRKYLRDLFFVNYSKQIFACNELPRVYDFSKGFWSRWILLEFPFQFLDESEFKGLNDRGKCKLRDIDIINKLTTEKELSGLLNMALDGLDRIIKNKDFSYSKGTDETKNFWIRNSDSFTAFCLDMIEDDYESKIQKKELRNIFNKYCKMHKIKGTSDKGMKVVMEDMFGAVEGRFWNGESQEPVWEGVRFKEKTAILSVENKISAISKVFPKVIENGIYSTFPKTSLIQLKSQKENKFTDSELEKAGLKPEDLE